jgi:hypothetical protein
MELFEKNGMKKLKLSWQVRARRADNHFQIWGGGLTLNSLVELRSTKSDTSA